jgi:adenylylsulfate kinase-like enzyme
MSAFMQKILVMGLPGSGKTTIAAQLATRLAAVHFNADAVRKNINQDLGFDYVDRLAQARRMGWLCDQVTKAGHYAVADFICPTNGTRIAFDQERQYILIFMNTVICSSYEDTNNLFVSPTDADFTFTDHNVNINLLADMITTQSYKRKEHI